MQTLYLTKQGATLRKTGRRLVVEHKGETVLQVPTFSVKRVIIYGHIGVTAEALRFLMQEGVSLSYLTTRGQFAGTFYTPASSAVYLRLAQYERYLEVPFRVELARAMIRGKVANQRVVVNHLLKRRPDISRPLQRQLTDAIEQIEQVSDLDVLRGLEGQASGAYFRILGAYLAACRGELRFESRSRRPPRDPINAMLSLGYTFLTSEVTGQLQARGLEPNLGFLHGIKHGRPSLALDVVEEFRAPIVDRLVLSLANQKVFGLDDFEPVPEGGCYFKEEKLPLFLVHYDKKMNTAFIDVDHNEYTNYRRRIGTQIDHLARVLQHEDPAYRPFRIV